jgi:H+/gluconate symporter-like permease
MIGLLGILVALGVLIWLSFRGWSVLILAPGAALLAAIAAGEPLLAHWTQTFMRAAAGFIAQFFPLFLLGALLAQAVDDLGHFLARRDRLSHRRRQYQYGSVHRVP